MGKGKLRVAVIGCGDAGLSAAFAANKLGADVTVISDEEIWYPRCPLPYYISGKIAREDLVKPLKKMFLGTNVKTIKDRADKIEGGKVLCDDCEVKFDTAVIATGGSPKKLPDALTLRTMEDADNMKKLAKKLKPVIIGGGLLGCELGDVLGGTIIEAQNSILANFDSDISEIIHERLSQTVDIRTGTTKAPKSDFTISSIGVHPENELAKKSGIKTSDFGIVVDNRLETSMPGVFAAGDCMEEKCFFTKKPMYSFLGPQSEREGVITGTNASGGEMKYEGSLNAVVAKISDYEVGVTGMCTLGAKEKGMKPVFGKIKAMTKAEYYKDSKELIIKMLFEDEKLVGCQAIGGESIQGIINLATYAMQHGATVDDLINLAYCYSPPICASPNPVIMCAENAKRRMRK